MFWTRRYTETEGDSAWILSFADLMSLLMAVFIMIASVSELRHGRRFDRMRLSVQAAFGFPLTADESLEVSAAVRPPTLAERLERLGLAAATGEVAESLDLESQVPCDVVTRSDSVLIRIGGGAVFDSFSASLKPAGERLLRRLATYLGDGRGRIEVRCYAGDGSIPAEAPFRDASDLSYQRARAVASVLWAVGVPAQRVELVACGDVPLSAAETPAAGSGVNRRIEIVVRVVDSPAAASAIAEKGLENNAG